MTTRGAAGSRPSPVVLTACATAVLAGAVAGLFASGVRTCVIESPSMGRAAPVGSLVLVLPTTTSELDAGDVVAFRPPEPGAALHVHREVASTPAGLRTRGDLNTAEDPWPLTDDTLVGRAALVLPGGGWVLRALPLLLLGLLAATRGARLLAPALRAPARLAVWSLVAIATSALLHPWTGVVPLPGAPGAGVRVVSTGLLPQRVEAVAVGGGAATTVGATDLRYGGTGTIAVPAGYDGVRLQVRTRWDPTAGWRR